MAALLSISAIRRWKASNARLVFFKSAGARENHKAAHAPICPVDRELPSIDLNLAPKIE